MSDVVGRRPLKVRNVELSRRFARWLSRRSVTPNQISMASLGFAILAAGCLLAIPRVDGAAVWIPAILAVLFIQCRLLCNLFDGMVAVEGGKSTPSGELFNDIPDRIADPLILIAAGHATQRRHHQRRGRIFRADRLQTEAAGPRFVADGVRRGRVSESSCHRRPPGPGS